MVNSLPFVKEMCLKGIIERLKWRRHRFSSRSSISLPSGTSSVVVIEKGGPEIIIVGAGAAGLACAMHLLNNGFTNVHILEAEERIGGRIYTVPFGKNFIDLGAQFVHGEVGNKVFNLVQHLNLLDSSSDIFNNCQCIRSNGEVVPQNTVKVLKRAASRIFEEEIVNFHRTFNEYLKVRFFQCLKSLKMENCSPEIAEEFIENFAKLESSESSTNLHEISLKSFTDYHLCPGDYMLNWKDKGFISFLRVLIKANNENTLGDLEGRILFGNTVERIEWDYGDGKARVKSKNDTNVRLADHVVLTMSLGVLKERVDTMFQPELPIPKKKAIVALGFACTCKIYLEFAEVFWPEGWTGFATLWRKKDLEHLRRSRYSWLEDIFGVYCVKYQPRLLQAWAVGANIVKLEKLPQQELKIGILKLLREFLKSWVVPEPIAIEVTRWATHPNFRGSYSFQSMLTEELNVTPLNLQDPLVVLIELSRLDLLSKSDHSLRTLSIKPIVQFAGEATSEKYFSTVHGAVESGYREANRIIQFYTHCLYNL